MTAYIGYKSNGFVADNPIDDSTKPEFDKRDNESSLQSTKDGYNFTSDG